jgi:hypothetical protein
MGETVSDGWLGFFGGILATLVGALVASIIQRRNEVEKRKEQAHLDAYFLLVDLKNWYFWVTTAELHGEEPKAEVLDTCRKLAYQLNDKIRSFDEVEQVEEVLTVLFSESIPTAHARATRLDGLVDRYGQLLHPRYAKTILRISHENILRHGTGQAPSSNAPGSWSYRQ